MQQQQILKFIKKRCYLEGEVVMKVVQVLYCKMSLKRNKICINQNPKKKKKMKMN